MRINQGVVGIISSVLGIILFHYLGMDNYNALFFMLFGFSLVRFDKYWGEKNDD